MCLCLCDNKYQANTNKVCYYGNVKQILPKCGRVEIIMTENRKNSIITLKYNWKDVVILFRCSSNIFKFYTFKSSAMMLNQSQDGIQYKKQVGVNCTWNRNWSYARPDHKGFGGLCEVFLQRPLRPLSTLISPRERALRDVTSITT